MNRWLTNRTAIPLAAAILIALAGCAAVTPAGRPGEDEMMTTAAALTKISAAVEANLRYGSTTVSVSDAEFLAQSVAHDPTLLAPFDHYRLTLRREALHADLLVCSDDGSVALLEDAGCTAALDAHRWRETPLSSCTFVLDLTRICPRVSSSP